ncbi:MAG: hypothetical protein QXD86_06075 [Candidatus Bathyarchaeia archaeon]
MSVFDLAWVFSLIAPFIIGLLAGLIVKRTFKLMIIAIALIIVLAATGYISLTFTEIYDKAMAFLPRIVNTGMAIGDVLPYSSTAFLIGLALGIWKG